MYRNLLFIPADQPRFYSKVGGIKPDCLIFDLEDSVKNENKDKALTMLKCFIEENKIEIDKFVRINDFEDINKLIELDIQGFVIPKVEMVFQIEQIEQQIINFGNNKKFKLILIIESAIGINNVLDIVKASKNVIGIGFGGEDYCSDINCENSRESLLYARSKIINTAKAYKVECYDTVFLNYKDETLFKEEVLYSKKLGFDGKFIINPNQIDLANDIFGYSETYLKEIKKIIESYEENNQGILIYGEKIFELPHIKKMKKILDLCMKNINFI